MKPLNVLIREIREDRDLTQTQVAKALGIAQQYYSKYETGEYELPIRHLIGLAQLYNLNTDYILGLTKYRYPIDKLNEPFLNEMPISKMLSGLISLNLDGRKSLIEYLE
ncbi:MAG: helix-turn-helix transcriptional regulator, partial [Bacillota bacterium]|nr:helix-turn-helix transcriptional regulator [Bacillota bacterium]